jgi:NADH dehydrogenase FAD-containing subunit
LIFIIKEKSLSHPRNGLTTTTLAKDEYNMRKHLLLIGSGHAHLSILKNLKFFLLQGQKITVINPEPYHYYSGMGPGMLSGMYKPQQIRFNVKKMVSDQGGNFIQDHVVHIDPKNQKVQTATGEMISYDVACFNTGSYVPLPEFTKNLKEESFLFPVKPIQNLLFAQIKMISLLKEKRLKVIVVGGGAAGVEISANLRFLAENHKQDADITIIAGGKLLNRFNDRFRKAAKNFLRQKDIVLLEHSNVTAVSNHYVVLNTGISLPCDMVLWAVGTKPSLLFKRSGLPVGSDNGLLVNEFLQCVSFSNIFGGGDCISFKTQDLEKVGVYAVRQNPVLLENLNNFIYSKPLIPFIPQKEFLLILNMGNRQGLLKWKDFIFKGTTAFYLKNFIDQKFMKNYQISNERELNGI